MRITTTLVFSSVLLFTASGGSLLGQTPSASDREQSCRKFVQTFYDWYVSQEGRPSDIVRRYKPFAFSAELSRRLREDAEFKDKDKTGDLVGLDFDPFVGGQDTCEPYSYRKVTLTGSKCWVEVYGSACEKRTGPDVVPELVLMKGRWVFVNFHYPRNGKNGNLLRDLKSLRKDRKAQPAK
ncbi:MAG TPA: hypothetical protein VN176_12875 [Verrucomicrobiae bacterium]|jgi:hypothetical protein|nr:hypothetical protein [Verrucomicrobiae bacterium]